MSRDIKFRYVLKNKNTGKTSFRIESIETIEREGLKGIFDIENYDIITRDRFMGLTDKNGNDIYQGDRCFVDYNYLGTVIADFKNGTCNVSKYNLDKVTVMGNIHEN